MKRLISYLAIFTLAITFSNCKDYLDVKPDQKLVIPSTLKDLQAINDAGVNDLYPVGMDNASDDYFLSLKVYNAVRDQDARKQYVWDPDAVSDFDWQYQYKMIFDANVVLGLVDNIPQGGLSQTDKAQVKGSALFKRAYALFNLLVQYSLPYQQENLEKLGVPLRLNSSINERVHRNTIDEGFNQLLRDLQVAKELLPNKALVLTRPSKPAALALLSRVYLYMNQTQQSLDAVNEALTIKNDLIDYNNLSPNAANPFVRFNIETLFYGISSGRGGLLSQSRARVIPNLYDAYSANDLRKTLFYKSLSDGYAFKGDYSGKSSSQLFFGMTVDELYLNKAECEARLGDLSGSIATITSLLNKRFVSGTYIPPSSGISKTDLLVYILLERRKELSFRGMIRWMDFKRLKNDSQNRFAMERTLDADIFSIKPEDLKTAFLVPKTSILISGLKQNER